MVFLQIICPLLCPWRRKLIRINTVFKKLSIEEKEKLLGKGARGKMPRRNKKYHYIGSAGCHLSERHLLLCTSGRMEMGFICQHSNSDRQNLRYWQQALNVTLNSRKTCFCTVLLNNQFSYITHFNFIQVMVPRKKMCFLYVWNSITWETIFMVKGEKKYRLCVA